MLIEKHTLSNDMDACMDKPETLGWEELDAKYQTMLLLFGDILATRVNERIRDLNSTLAGHAHARIVAWNMR
ncbi:hypothetical protein L1987_74234 [Smallanthus sonchifolius]|uniref:Uncharacterized protein n=1 Tax=Smallanthus sonchifolius TaxID=185202 RepID=A0ACB9A242_9ASTR|nr:hypothetical protein L1987_74234 [Smallanthus sonchifolius]